MLSFMAWISNGFRGFHFLGKNLAGVNRLLHLSPDGQNHPFIRWSGIRHTPGFPSLCFYGVYPFILLFPSKFSGCIFLDTQCICTDTIYTRLTKNSWLYVFGISIGLGMLSKYSVAFYTASLLAALLLTRHRTLYLNKHFYIAGAIALFIMLPNILWQYNHGFPLIAHMEELKEEQLQFIHPADFLTDQIMMFLPCVFIWLAGLYFTAFTKEGKPYRMVAFTYLFIIALLTYMNGKSYYAAGAYPILFALVLFILKNYQHQRKTNSGMYLWPSQLYLAT